MKNRILAPRPRPNTLVRYNDRVVGRGRGAVGGLKIRLQTNFRLDAYTPRGGGGGGPKRSRMRLCRESRTMR